VGVFGEKSLKKLFLQKKFYFFFEIFERMKSAWARAQERASPSWSKLAQDNPS
jgi:hypothetical protein